MRSPYIEHAASGLPNTTRLEGEVRFVQTQDQQVFMFENRNRVFTHSLDVTGPDSSVGRVSAPENGRSRVRSRAATYQSRKKWY